MSVRRSTTIALARSFVAALAVVLGSCEGSGPSTSGPRYLSEWEIFQPGTHDPMPDVVPYEILAPLFSDYASKHRFFRLPEGETIEVVGGRWDFPVGTVLVKSFGFWRDEEQPELGDDLVETRLLVHEAESVWRPYVYVWNEDHTDAELTPAGRIVPIVRSTGDELDYRVPSHTQCRNCHGGSGETLPLGPRTAQMDVMHDFGAGPVSQLQHYVDIGALAEMPASESVELVDYRPVLDRLTEATDREIDDAARSYLHANCAHCHRDGGGAQQSALWIRIDDEPLHATDPSRLGICRTPIAGGCREYGSVTIRPGHPEDSILMCRIESTRAGDKMPELPSVLVYHEANELVREWIRRMPATCPPAP